MSEIILNTETVEMDTIIAYKRQGKKVIIGNLVRAIKVNTPDGGTGYFYRKDGAYQMDHAGTHNVGEYETVHTNFDEYTAALKADDAQNIAQVDSLVSKIINAGGTEDDIKDVFADWATDTAYKVGKIVKYSGNLYKCLQAHTSQASWTPSAASSLWARVSNPGEEWPAWVQPTGATDAYSIGDKVSHNSKHWESTCNVNVWEPGVYGWDEVTE